MFVFIYKNTLNLVLEASVGKAVAALIGEIRMRIVEGVPVLARIILQSALLLRRLHVPSTQKEAGLRQLYVVGAVL